MHSIPRLSWELALTVSVLVSLLHLLPGVNAYYDSRTVVEPPACPNSTYPLIISSSGTSFQSFHPYAAKGNCYWIIRAGAGQRILLSFQYFATQYSLDTVSIFENFTSAQSCTNACTASCPCLTATLSGNQLSQSSYESTTNEILVTLITSFLGLYEGFIATVEFVPSSMTYSSLSSG